LKLNELVKRAINKNNTGVAQATGVFGYSSLALPIKSIPKTIIKGFDSNKLFGANYRVRLIRHKDSLLNTVRDSIIRNSQRPAGVSSLAKNITSAMNTYKNATIQLLRSETTLNIASTMKYVGEKTKQSKYRYDGIEDSKTCQYCLPLIGTVHKFSEAVPGDNFPPMHARGCRCGITFL